MHYLAKTTFPIWEEHKVSTLFAASPLSRKFEIGLTIGVSFSVVKFGGTYCLDFMDTIGGVLLEANGVPQDLIDNLTLAQMDAVTVHVLEKYKHEKVLPPFHIILNEAFSNV